MQIKFTGDFAQLQKFVDKVQRLPDVLITVNQQLCEETIELVRECFEEQQDPHGRPWEEHEPLTKLARPGGRILEERNPAPAF